MKLIIFKTTVQDNGWGSLESYPSEWNSFPVHYAFDKAKKEVVKDFQMEYKNWGENWGTDYYFIIPSFYKTETVTCITFNFYIKDLSFEKAMKVWKEDGWRIDPDISIAYDIVDVDAIK